MSRDSELASLNAQAAVLKAQIERRQDELSTITARMAELVGFELGQHSGPGYRFTVAENNTYPKAAMEAALSPGQVKRCSRAVLDSSVVKRLYPEVYAKAKVNNGYKVTIAR